MMKKSLPYQMRKRQTFALLVMIGLILSLQSIFFYSKTLDHNDKTVISDLKFSDPQKKKLNLKQFDPNLLSENDWENLGFSEKQIKTILKYKDIVGGVFVSKAQLKKCYAISEEKFSELEDFILLPEEATAKSFNHNKTYDKKLTITGRFNPDHLSQSDWQNLGFSEKQAAAILKYKAYLGGSFVSKDLLKECFMINDAQFTQLKPYIILPEKTPDNFRNKNYAAGEKINYKKFDPNTLSQSDWQNLGFSEKQAVSILNYKNKILKGRFTTLEDVKNCYMISEAKFNAMKNYIVLTPGITPSNLPTKPVAIQETDFANIDLNKITFKQLQEFGFDEHAAASYLGFRKKLGGFMTTTQILDTYNVDKELAKKLVNTAKLNTDGIVKYTLADAPEDWLKNHPYFKYSADKIIFYRLTYPDDQKIWKYLKLKPEYETRMKLYLK